jgi:hypothetical protein
VRVGLAVSRSLVSGIVTLPAKSFETDRRLCHRDRCCHVITLGGRGFDALDELGHPVEPEVCYVHHFSTGGSFRQRKPAVAGSRSTYHSVGAGVRWSVRRVIWATEAVVVNAADEMTPSNAKAFEMEQRQFTRLHVRPTYPFFVSRMSPTPWDRMARISRRGTPTAHGRRSVSCSQPTLAQRPHELEELYFLIKDDDLAVISDRPMLNSDVRKKCFTPGAAVAT